MAWTKYASYIYPTELYFEKILIWMDSVARLYFAMKVADEDDWTYFSGNPAHGLASGSLLVNRGTTEADAQTNYWRPTPDSDDRVLGVLPGIIPAKYIRIYVDDSNDNPTVIHEFRPSSYFAADEIITGHLRITDDFASPPKLSVTKDSIDRIEIGDISGSPNNYFGIIGRDDSSNTVFELSDNQLLLAGWTISQTTLANSTDIILDAANKAISINDATFGNAGIQLEYNAGTPRLYVGDGTVNNFLKFDGTNLTFSSDFSGTAVDILSGADITIRGGADIVIIGVDADPGKMILTSPDAGEGVEFYADSTSGIFRMVPQGNGTIQLNIGTSSLRFEEVDIFSDEAFTAWHFVDSDNYASLAVDDLSVNFVVRSSGNSGVVRLATNAGGTEFYLLPTSGNVDLGSSSFKWKDGYFAGNVVVGDDLGGIGGGHSLVIGDTGLGGTVAVGKGGDDLGWFGYRGIADAGLGIGTREGGTYYVDTIVITKGNVGIDVVPETWDSALSAIQVGGLGALSATTSAGAGGATYLTNNAYWDDNDDRWEYYATASDEAAYYSQVNGTHNFWVATAGTQDNPISWATALHISNSLDLVLFGNIIMPDGGTIGQAAGPLLTFDDSNNFLEITGCNVGIGTVDPQYLLSIGTLGTTTNTTIVIGSADDSRGRLFFGDGTGLGETGRGIVSYNHSNDKMSFATVSEDRFSIDSSGVVNISQLTASQDVQTDGSKNLVSVSDMTWKKDLGMIDNALDKIMQINPRYFTWTRDAEGKDLSKMDQPRLAGFFAQEIYDIFPEASPGGANIDSDGYEHWGLNSRAILALTVTGIQELDEKKADKIEIEKLKAEIQLLKRKYG